DRIRTRAFAGVCTSVFQAECVPDFVHEVVFAATRAQPVVVAVVVVLVDQRGIQPVIDPHGARVVAGDRPTPTPVGERLPVAVRPDRGGQSAARQVAIADAD